MELNLQHLPPHVLEKIFLYCADGSNSNAGNLMNLIKCNRFLKKFIETSPPLMDKLYLNIVIGSDSHSTALECRKNLSACLNSVRKYRKLFLLIFDMATYRAIERSNASFKSLFQKNLNLKHVSIWISVADWDVAHLELYSYLDGLKFLEKLVLRVVSGSGDLQQPNGIIPMPRSVLFPENRFENLKNLNIEISGNCHPMTLEILNRCYSVESLQIFIASETFFPSIHRIGAFLFERIATLLKEAPKLRKLKFNLIFPNIWQPQVMSNDFWDVSNLEVFDVAFSSNQCLNSKIVFNMPNQNLKMLTISGIDFQYMFERMTQNYRNLTKLVVKESCINYYADDILFVFKYLKKLEHFEFALPGYSFLNTDLLISSNENLFLPAIKYVRLKMNFFTCQYNMLLLCTLIKNVSTLILETDIGEPFTFNIRALFYNFTLMNILIPRLPNLSYLLVNGVKLLVD